MAREYVFSPTDPATSSLLGKWIGFKFVVYNFVQNGKTVVKTQNWLNVNNDKITWVKVDQNIDAGGWGIRQQNVADMQTK